MSGRYVSTIYKNMYVSSSDMLMLGVMLAGMADGKVESFAPVGELEILACCSLLFRLLGIACDWQQASKGLTK